MTDARRSEPRDVMADAREARRTAPDVVRLFPLPDHVFLPGFPSPYRIFEPRYRALVEDLMKLPDHEQWVGMPRLLRGRAATTAPPAPPFARLAAVGRVIHVHPLPNLQYLIVVGEAHRARLNEISSDAPYRQARIVERPRPVDADRAEPGGTLQRTYERILLMLSRLGASWGDARDTVLGALQAAPSLEDRVDLLGSLVLEAVDDRQAFLEAASLEQRLDRIETVLLSGRASALFGEPGGGPEASA
jgi:hypothetical protein